jgi:hypothetical protein
MVDMISLLYAGISGSTTIPIPPPIPHQWTLKCKPDNWIYTDSSDIKDNRHLGAAEVHFPSRTTIYIDAGDKLDINMALTTLATHAWI